jgi:hypothetical protein
MGESNRRSPIQFEKILSERTLIYIKGRNDQGPTIVGAN